MLQGEGHVLGATVSAQLGEDGAHVMLGCGDGDLLKLLIEKKQVKATGIEKSEKSVGICISKGLSVLHGDINLGLVAI